MLLWKKQFEDIDMESKLIYLVEGSTKKFDAKCGHGCVSKCGWPKVAEIEVFIL